MEDPPLTQSSLLRLPGDPTDLMRRDSAGVHIVENETPRWDYEGEPSWGLAIQPETTIRSPRTQSNTGGFTRISDLVVLGDGQIAVADGGTDEVFLFDSNGVSTGHFGGTGGGPGELWGVASLHTCDADSLYVGFRGSLDVFSPRGEYVRRARFDQQEAQLGFVGVSRTCTEYLLRGATQYPLSGNIRFGYSTFVWADTTFGNLRPFEDPVTLSEVRVVLAGGRTMYRPLPWTSNWAARVGIGTDRVVTGFGSEAELRIFGSDGALKEVVRWNADPDPVTFRDRQLYAERRSRFLSEFGSSPETRAVYPPLNDLPEVPSQKPIFDGLLVDDQNHIWVRHFPSTSVGSTDTFFRIPIEYPPEQWTVFDSTGIWLGSIELPGHFQLYAVAMDRAYGVHTDPQGVESVIVFGIIR